MAEPKLKRSRPAQGQSLYDYIVRSEGKGKEGRPGYAYRDHKGNLTIGVGHLVTRNDPVLKRIAGANYSVVMSGRRPLDSGQMQQLFDHDVQAKIKLAKRKVGNFDKLPKSTQNAIVDGFFRGDLSGSPKALKLMNSGDLKAAAVEYLNSNEYRKSKKERTGVAPRMERNAAAFRSGHFLKGKSHPTVKRTLEGEGVINGGDGKQYYRLRKARS
jgi:GH24 family phage-related lysozyme (muramidase)|tara:strand:- start:406 stop:1047 length:642 start_codon:yes stop_codon:yes gene_type:complete